MLLDRFKDVLVSLIYFKKKKGYKESNIFSFTASLLLSA